MRTDRTFFAILALVSAAPLVIVPAAVALSGDAAVVAAPGFALLLIAVTWGHVAASAFPYLDPEFRPVIAGQRIRLVAMLAIAPAIAIAIVALSPVAGALAFAPFLVWQFWHFSRQSYGLAAFAGASSRPGPMPARLSDALGVAAIGAALLTLRYPSIYPGGLDEFAIVGPGAARILALLGISLFAAAAIWLAWILRAERRPLVVLFSILGLALYLPSALADNYVAAFLPIAISHGLQYLVMTGILARRARSDWSSAAAWLLSSTAIAALFLILVKIPLIWPAYLGLTAVHFLLDAKIWRLREPAQRAIIRRRFAFLFAPAVLRETVPPALSRAR